MEDYKIHGEELRKQIYEIYKSVFNLSSTTQKKCSIMTPVLGGYEISWRVIGITEAALKLLSESGYKYQKGTICRAHIISRYDTAKQIFEREAPVGLDEFFEIVWKNDRTIISTKGENKTKGHLPNFIPINYQDNFFQCNPVVGFRYRRAERDYLQNLHNSFKAGDIILVSPYIGT